MPIYHGYTIRLSPSGQIIDVNGHVTIGGITKAADTWQCTVYRPYASVHKFIHHGEKDAAIAAIVKVYKRHIESVAGKLTTANPQSLPRGETVDGFSIT